MMNQAASDLAIINGQFTRETITFNTIPDQQLIYEVFRIDQGQPVFLNDHLNRLFNSIINTNHSFSISEPEIKKSLLSLVQQSKALNGNIKIEVCFLRNKSIEQYYRAFFIPTSYPDETMYKEGVFCNFLEKERDNPSIKMANPILRNLSDSIIKKENIYETFLVNKDGKITEGSRSNLFFIKSGEVFTAPSQMVLEGIMRQKVIQVIKESNIKLNLEAVSITNLQQYEACFITGTSPRVLPVKKVADITFKVPEKLTTKVSLLINELINNHINLNKTI